ncbi:MAG: alpha-L-fucosidase [Planctomycetota bacterium]
MKRAALALVLVVISPALHAQDPAPGSRMVPEGASVEEVVRAAAEVRPHLRQVVWQEMGFTAFVHFGMNTFTDREWGEGNEDPALFDPKEFDADQWVASFRAAGMKGLVLTAKHHDGFCLWPTRTTPHSVAASPFRDGKGDVVGEVAAACRRAGLRFGIYLSPWDRNAKSFGTKEYDELFHAQLRELMTDYGPLYDVWFDGAHAPADRPEIFDWARHFALVRKLQPMACLSIVGPDVRWCGNEAGRTRAEEWSVVPLPTDLSAAAEEDWRVAAAYRSVDVQAADLGSRARLAGARRLVWWPAVTNTSIRPGWFHHPAEDGSLKGLLELFDLWVAAVGGNGHLLLNVPPDRRGRIAEGDAARLAELGALLDATFGRDLAADATRKNYGGRVLEVIFPEARAASFLDVREDVESSSQRVESFRLDAFDGNAWREVSRGSTIGMRRILRLPTTPARGWRVWVTSSRGAPALAALSVHRTPDLLDAPRIDRDREGRVSLTAPGAGSILFTVDGSEPGEGSSVYLGPFPLPEGGRVRARAVPKAGAAVFAAAGASQSERRFGLAKGGWRIHAVSSEQAPAEAAALAIDEDPDTLWHTRYSPDTPKHPHSITLDLGAERAVGSVLYTPRRGQGNGTILRLAIEVSRDGKTWETAVPARELENMKASPTPREIPFDAPRRVRYLRLVALEEIAGRPWASAAEIDVFAP